MIKAQSLVKLRRRVEEVASAEPQPKSNFVHFILKQGSHASWKVLDFFFFKIPGPGKSWKITLVLESPGKISWKITYFLLVLMENKQCI